MKKMEGMVALVTGAGTGLGRAMCTAYAVEGAKVAVVYNSSREGAEKTLEIIRSLGSDGIAVQCDAGDVESVQRMIRETVEKLGRIDVLMNNGSARDPGRLIGYPVESWDHVMDVNVRGMFFGMQEAAKYMKEQGYGKIINVSSIMALRPSSVTRVAYTSSKRAIMSMTRAAAKELEHTGIRVNCIIPGSFTSYAATDNPDANKAIDQMRKKVIPLGHKAHVDEMKGLAVFLACHDSDYIDGECYKIDGGWACND